MREQTIAYLPELGYHPKAMYSKASKQWFAYLHATEGLVLRTEYPVPGTHYHVDGMHEPTNTLYEYLGCWVHGECAR